MLKNKLFHIIFCRFWGVASNSKQQTIEGHLSCGAAPATASGTVKAGERAALWLSGHCYIINLFIIYGSVPHYKEPKCQTKTALSTSSQGRRSRLKLTYF